MLARFWWAALLAALLLGIAARAQALEPIDLNTAPLGDLLQLPGVGPKRANDIVKFRSERGFRRPADLMRIKGIGRRTYVKLLPLVRVKPAVPAEGKEVLAGAGSSTVMPSKAPATP